MKLMDLQTAIILISTGLIAGFLGGFVGVGGGIVMVPAMVLLLGISQHMAQGTSLAVLMLPIGVLGVVNYYKAGYVNFYYALIIAIAFVLGNYLGSRFAVNMDASFIKKAFGVFMIIVALRFIFGK
jgi:uncharacterized protein